jgi:hypothetical protein
MKRISMWRRTVNSFFDLLVRRQVSQAQIKKKPADEFIVTAYHLLVLGTCEINSSALAVGPLCV